MECVGCADRSAYDLTQHTKATGVKLMAEKKLPEPKKVDVTEAVPNKALLGKHFKTESKLIIEKLANLSLNELAALEKTLNDGGSFAVGTAELTKEMVSVKTISKVVHVEEITPNVIEPSFGIGRIMYSLLEHRFNMREGDEQRCYISLPSVVAPIKCSVLPLSNNADLAPFVKQIGKVFAKALHSVIVILTSLQLQHLINEKYLTKWILLAVQLGEGMLEQMKSLFHLV